jgi:hypothetical protein
MSGYLDFSILDCFDDHGYPTHGIHGYGYSPSSRLPRHRHKGLSSLLLVFSSHSIHTAPTLYLRGMSFRWFLPSASSPVSPSAVLLL